MTVVGMPQDMPQVEGDNLIIKMILKLQPSKLSKLLEWLELVMLK